MNPALLSTSAAQVFPPALVPVLRECLKSKGPHLSDVADEVLVQLLTTIFWAGLETYEGERNAIGVVFLGKRSNDFIFPKGGDPGAAPIYEWKILRFDSPRPFAISELVKLAVAGVDRRIYTAVGLHDGQLAISGLAREGFKIDLGPFIKIITSGPGSLSIRRGRDLLLGYERGSILIGEQNIVFSAGPVRRALEATARAAGLDDDDVVPDYVDTVRALVREMMGQGRGGILIISLEKYPTVAAGSYKMTHDSSLVSLLRLARRIGQTKSHDQSSRTRQHNEAKTHSRASENSQVDTLAFGSLLGNAFLIEAERIIERIGALSAIDGAILLNRALALIAFGVVLPLGRPTAVAEAMDAEGLNSRLLDLGSHGTRHRAAVSYAAEHPGSVVFVASEDRHVSCVFRHSSEERTLFWRLDPAAV